MYSQNDEEKVILNYFKGTRVGLFLDIGAYDGQTFSNTYALSARGWGGTLVEASPHSFVSLEDLYRGQDGFNLVMALVGDKWGVRTFWNSRDAISTDDTEHKNKWESLANYQKIYVPMLPVWKLLEMFPGPYDFINIDVEGIMNMILLETILPLVPNTKMVCVEADGNKDNWAKLGGQHGLKEIHRTGENIILCRQ